MKKILASLLLSAQALADCPNVTLLKANAPAPCEGFLFSRALELENRTKLEEFKTLQIQYANDQKIIASQTELVKQVTDQSTLWKNESDSLSKELARKETNKWLYFGLGIATAILTGFVVKKVNN